MTNPVRRVPAPLLRLAAYHDVVTLAELPAKIGHGIDRVLASLRDWEVYDHPRAGEPPRTDVYYLVT